MYLDVVLDQNYRPIFNDTPENVRDYLIGIRNTEDVSSLIVVPGENMETKTVNDYLESAE